MYGLVPSSYGIPPTLMPGLPALNICTHCIRCVIVVDIVDPSLPPGLRKQVHLLLELQIGLVEVGKDVLDYIVFCRWGWNNLKGFKYALVVEVGIAPELECVPVSAGASIQQCCLLLLDIR
jgi:hypothetical protein